MTKKSLHKSLNISFPFAPVSYNNAYGGKRRFLTSEARQFKKTVEIMSNDCRLDFDPTKEALQVEYTFTLKKITKKDGGLYQKRHDYDGFIKLFQDSLFDSLGIDDSNIVNATVYKREGSPSIKAKVWTIPLNTIYN